MNYVTNPRCRKEKDRKKKQADKERQNEIIKK